MLAAPSANRPRAMFGPFKIERGLTTIMRSSTGFEPTEAPHVRKSELCATCHTLVTKARGPGGEVIGELPEQMPFLEWKHSALASEGRSCQSCHMPVIDEAIPIASVLGAPRQEVARHSFVGGNFFVQQMLNRYRDELGVVAPAAEMDEAARMTLRNLQQSTAAVAIDRVAVVDGRLVADVSVRNLTGHKFPTGYPSRRAWIHLVVRDGAGRPIFESGATNPDGSIVGNANDRDPLLVEPHHSEIRNADDVQIYESIMEDARGRPTTGLLSGVRFMKDNRLLPAGFDKRTADAWIAVIGAARDDDDFNGAGDRVRYSIDVGRSAGPFQVDAEIRFQVIGFRWAETLKQYQSEETARFVTYYESMAASSSVVIVSAQKRD
jgi:hypothetical protein